MEKDEEYLPVGQRDGEQTRKQNEKCAAGGPSGANAFQRDTGRSRGKIPERGINQRVGNQARRRHDGESHSLRG